MKLPNGAAFYNNALARTTTTHMTADQIHELGIAEVTRIHNEMRTIMQKVHYKGSLQEFLDLCAMLLSSTTQIPPKAKLLT